MVFPVIGGDGKPTGYDISNSVRVGFGHELTKTFTGVSAERKKHTVSCWAKRGNLGDENHLIYAIAGSNSTYIRFNGDDTLRFRFYDGGADQAELVTNRLFRDPSAWYHIVLVYDSTQGTASNRVKIYVNGVQETSFSTEDYPDQNEESIIGNSATHKILGQSSAGDFYVSEWYYIGNQALSPSDFGETNSNGVWVPKEFTGSFGSTNDTYLQFKQTGTSANSSGIGADTSGEDNHWGVTNLTSVDVTTDTPTNNFATLNPLTARTHPELREGNLQQYEHGSTNSAGAAATIMPINGKWYAELFLNGPSDNDYPMIGITDTINLNQQGAQGTKMAAGFEMSGSTNNQGTTNLGTITNTNTGWPDFSDNDIVMYALDCDNRKLWLGRNGTWINSGDPAGNSNQQLSWTLDANVCPFLLGYDNSQSGGGGDESMWNYGNPPFSISSSNSDANGYGNFEYEVPSGYYALCTKNLAEFG